MWGMSKNEGFGTLFIVEFNPWRLRWLYAQAMTCGSARDRIAIGCYTVPGAKKPWGCLAQLEKASKQGRESDKTKSMFQDSDFDVLDDDMEDVEGEIIHTATTGVSVVSAPVATMLSSYLTKDPKDKELLKDYMRIVSIVDRAQKERQKQEEATSAA
ncbi:hypothetical protein Tco_0845421 [Tanacetum coccineum]